MGCLTWPFKLLGVFVVIALIVGAWLYRDRLVPTARKLAGHAAAGDMGRPTESGLHTARARVDSLDTGRADSVVLSAGEMASILGAGLDPSVRGRLDSLSVRLGRGMIQVAGRLDTRRLPAELVGPLGVALRERERVIAAGPVTVTGPGRAEWRVQQLQIRDFPFPRDMVPKVVEKALGDSTRQTLPIHLPRGVGDIRIAPTGVTLYGVHHR